MRSVQHFARFTGYRCAPFLLLAILSAVSARADVAVFPSGAAPGQSVRAFATPEPDDRSIPFTFQPPSEPYIVVKGKLNGVPMQFLVDTGTSYAMILFPWAVEQAKIPVTDQKTTLSGVTGETRSVPLLGDATLRLIDVSGNEDARFNMQNGVEIDEPSFLKGASAGHIAGIIGAGVLTGMLNHIDFDKKTITFSPDTHPPLARSGSVGKTFPLQKFPGVDGPYINAEIKALDGRKTSLLFLLDTGKAQSSIPFPLSTARAFLPSDTPMITRKSSSASGNADRPSEFILLPELDMGDLTAAHVPFSLMPNAGSAILGMDVISRFNLTIDGANGLITLEPRSGYQPRPEGVLGVSVTEREGNIYIDDIDSGRVPSGSDIAVGDQIVSVDGHPLKGVSASIASGLLDGYAGDEATLVLERPGAGGGKKITLHLMRHDPFSKK